MSKNDPRLKGMDVRYGGRTLKVEILINTDEDDQVVAKRLYAAARGPKMHMSVITVGEVDAEKAKLVWEQLIAASHEQAAREGKT